MEECQQYYVDDLVNTCKQMNVMHIPRKFVRESAVAIRALLMDACVGSSCSYGPQHERTLYYVQATAQIDSLINECLTEGEGNDHAET